MRQYLETKQQHRDAILLFRMGDFYELFFEDAQKAAAVLGITLTARGQHGGNPIPMAGVPAHAMEAYLAKLVRAGFKVALCDQLEDAAEAKPTYPAFFGIERSRALAAECVARADIALASVGLAGSHLAAIANWVVTRKN